eukprot:scaffold177965_cov41-Tisochrysis_lutea.AAC.1
MVALCAAPLLAKVLCIPIRCARRHRRIRPRSPCARAARCPRRRSVAACTLSLCPCAIHHAAAVLASSGGRRTAPAGD